MRAWVGGWGRRAGSEAGVLRSCHMHNAPGQASDTPVCTDTLHNRPRAPAHPPSVPRHPSPLPVPPHPSACASSPPRWARAQCWRPARQPRPPPAAPGRPGPRPPAESPLAARKGVPGAGRGGRCERTSGAWREIAWRQPPGGCAGRVHAACSEAGDPGAPPRRTQQACAWPSCEIEAWLRVGVRPSPPGVQSQGKAQQAQQDQEAKTHDALSPTLTGSYTAMKMAEAGATPARLPNTPAYSALPPPERSSAVSPPPLRMACSRVLMVSMG